ncbi:hypothetical protein EGW08_012640, partial [Elysia chlorotica]
MDQNNRRPAAENLPSVSFPYYFTQPLLSGSIPVPCPVTSASMHMPPAHHQSHMHQNALPIRPTPLMGFPPYFTNPQMPINTSDPINSVSVPNLHMGVPPSYLTNPQMAINTTREPINSASEPNLHMGIPPSYLTNPQMAINTTREPINSGSVPNLHMGIPPSYLTNPQTAIN